MEIVGEHANANTNVNKSNSETYDSRVQQVDQGSLTMNLPKQFSQKANLKKGDYLSC